MTEASEGPPLLHPRSVPAVSLNEVARIIGVGIAVFCTENVHKSEITHNKRESEVLRISCLLGALVEAIGSALSTSDADQASIKFRYWRKTRRLQRKYKPRDLWASVWSHPDTGDEWVLISEEERSEQSIHDR